MANRKSLVFLILSLVMISCGKISTEDAKNLYIVNKTEFDKMFKSYSKQKQIRSINLNEQYGFQKFNIGLFTQNEKAEYKVYDRVIINPEFSLEGNIEFDESTIELLKSKNLDVKQVTEYCKFVKKFKLYEIEVLGNPFEFGDLFMYRRNTVRFMLNPYQGFEYTRPAGQPHFSNKKEALNLDSNLYYFTEL